MLDHKPLIVGYVGDYRKDHPLMRSGTSHTHPMNFGTIFPITRPLSVGFFIV